MKLKQQRKTLQEIREQKLLSKVESDTNTLSLKVFPCQPWSEDKNYALCESNTIKSNFDSPVVVLPEKGSEELCQKSEFSFGKSPMRSSEKIRKSNVDIVKACSINPLFYSSETTSSKIVRDGEFTKLEQRQNNDFQHFELKTPEPSNNQSKVLNMLVTRSIEKYGGSTRSWSDKKFIRYSQFCSSDINSENSPKHENSRSSNDGLLDWEEELDIEQETIPWALVNNKVNIACKLPPWLLKIRKENPARDTKKYEVNPDTLETRHPNIKPQMIAVLIDWMMEVSAELDLRRQTFFLAYHYLIKYIDSSEDIIRKNLQLIGSTTLFMACKMEELLRPSAALFTYITQNSYTCKQLLAMEKEIVKHLQWNLSPTTLDEQLQESVKKWDQFLEK